MKILYCIAGTYNSGGMERVLSNKANYLAAHGHEVTIVTTDQRGQSPFFELDRRIRCIDIGVNYETNNGKSFFNKVVHYPFKQFKHKRRLAKVLNEVRPDIAISMFCNDASLLPRIKDGSKKVLEIHFSRFKRLQYDRKGLWRVADKWRNRNELKVASRFDRFVVLTHEDSRYWGNLPNMSVIPNARTFTCDTPAPLDRRRVIAVGRYTYQKGFDMLLDAWAKVCSQISGWELHIIGDGELRDALASQIKALSLQGSVVLCPATKNIKAAYQESSIIVMSSRYEGFGMVLLEAATAGVPAVSFDCKCGPSEIIKDGMTGFLVKDGDTSELARKILMLMRDEALRKEMGRKAFARSSQFSTDTVMKQWLSLFEGLACNA